MDPSLFEAAEVGNIAAFNDHTSNLHLLLTPNNNTLLHIHITAQSETIPEITDFVEKILDLCPSLLEKANTNGETPLHMAARYGRSHTVELLIERAKTLHEGDLERGLEGAQQMLRKTNNKKDTALHEAVRFNRLDVVKLLIKEDPHLSHFSYSSNDAGETPLYLAAERGFHLVVSEILRTCTSLPHAGPNTLTALHASVIREDLEITSDILKVKGPGITKEADQQGWTPLHYAAFFDHGGMAELLLDVDISSAYLAADRDGNKTALHIAASRGNVHTVEMLISRCPACWELVDVRGWNFFHFAAESYNLKTILSDLKVSFHNNVSNEEDNDGNARLLRLGASINNLLNEKDNDGNTPLHLLLASTSDIDSIFWITDDGRFDKMGFNNKNLNSTDIIRTNDKLTDPEDRERMIYKLEGSGARSGQRTITAYKEVWEMDESTTREARKHFEELQKATNTQLIVATLIATVTFAAGFTLPGGYINDKGHDQGTAILSRKAAFKAFVFSDTLAMVFSISSVFIHLFLALQTTIAYGTPSDHFLKSFFCAFGLTASAMILMLVAFITGLYAVLEHSAGISIAVCFFPCCFFFYFCYISIKNFYKDLYRLQ